MKPVLVGEANPYGADPRYALWPKPRGSAGDRLCRVVLGMERNEYFWTFDRANLCATKWRLRDARVRADELKASGAPLVLLGARVCSAFAVPFSPFTFGALGSVPSFPVPWWRTIALPHPSGRARSWNDPFAVARARKLVAAFLGRLGGPSAVPEVVDVGDPANNMYGCSPCPACGGAHRASYNRSDAATVECDDCGWCALAEVKEI